MAGSVPVGHVVSFINYKGGVGKSTTTYHIGCALAHVHGKRVLLVDIDPQCSLTFLCMTPDRWMSQVRGKGASVVSLYEQYLNGKVPSVQRAVWPSPIQDLAGKPLLPKLDLIPSDVDLLTDPDVRWSGTRRSKRSALAAQISEIKVRAETYVLPRIFLKTVLGRLRKDYDYILIDCPPNLYLLTQNALLASDAYVITALPDHLSTIGIELLQRGAADIVSTVTEYGRLVGESIVAPKVRGIIFVKVLRQQPTRMHAETIDAVTKKYPTLVFHDYTTELTGYQEASAQAVPVFMLKTTNAKRASDQYLAITNEFVRRFP